MDYKNISLEDLDRARTEYEKTLAQTKTIAYGATGLFFLFFAWACLAS